MDKLSALINKLETKIPFSNKSNNSVSQAPVGWHIQHTILAAMQIIKAVENSDPQNYQWKFNVKRLFVYTLNKIPRGKGKAPKSVLPTEVFDTADLIKEIQLLKLRIKDLYTLKANNYFVHPYFGSLNLKAAVKMLQIHTKHHIGIINDIIKT